MIAPEDRCPNCKGIRPHGRGCGMPCWMGSHKLARLGRSRVVDGIEYEPREKYGAWYEVDDPTPSGTVGRTYIPMMNDGSMASDEPVEISVSYEEA